MDAGAVLPDRSALGMGLPFLRAYAQRLVRTCHRRGCSAMGGMSAFVPVRSDPAATERAFEQVRADKLREVTDGCDGTWVAHPGLVPVAQEIFDRHMPQPNQIDRIPAPAEGDLLSIPTGPRTDAGLRHNLRVGLHTKAWLRGRGCVASTARWRRHRRDQPHAVVVLGEARRRRGQAAWTRPCSTVSSPSAAADPGRGGPRPLRWLLRRAADLFGPRSPLKSPMPSLPCPPTPTFTGPCLEKPQAHPAPRSSAAPPSIQHPYTRTSPPAAGSIRIEHTLAKRGPASSGSSQRGYPPLGAMTGGQAVQMARAGLKAIYCSGWQVAADANLSGQSYPDQSLYPANSVPALVKRLNNALQRTDQVEHGEGGITRDWFLPIVADAEAGFGGPLNAYELMKGMIEAGAAGVHFEDQLSSEKKCGHLGGKVLIPTGHFIRTLVAARLAADVMDVPTLVIARTDADSARLITSDIDDRDKPFLTGERTPEGFHRITGGVQMAIARAKAYAPYADLIWCETSTPDLKEAKEFAEGVHAEFPGKMLAYNCSPSFNWKKKLSDEEIATFQQELNAMGYKFQFITLAGFHSLNHGMFELASAYRTEHMTAYARLQEAEFASEAKGYTATKHQREVGTGYFDEVAQAISGGLASTLALVGSTESQQFH
jgi:isocitrate lyase